MKRYCLWMLPIFASCGGGEDGTTRDHDLVTECSGSVSPSNCELVEIQHVDASGIFQGTLDIIDGETLDVRALSYDNAERERLYFASDNVFFVADYETNSSGVFSGSGHVHDLDGDPVGEFTLDGVATAESSIRVAYERNNGDEGELELLFQDAVYYAGADLSMLDGSWEYVVEGYSISVNISGAGALDGADSAGCDLAGDFSVPDESVNTFEVNLSVTGCDEAFEAQGMAYVDNTETPSVLYVAVQSGDKFRAFAFSEN